MSNRLVGLIMFAFLIFITMKGDLVKYLAVVGLAPGPGDVAPAPVKLQSSGGGILGDIKTAAKVASTVATVAG